MGKHLNYNNELHELELPSPEADNPGFGLTEGIFETMRISNGRILFANHHFNRLFAGLAALRIKFPENFNADYLADNVLRLCISNGHEHAARAKLIVYNDDGTAPRPIDGAPAFVIESWDLNNEYIFNEEGLKIDIYPHATKQANDVSPYKTTTYFPYRYAIDYAREQELDDSLLMNTYKRVCDSSISNIFWIKDQLIYTPPLSEGCIDGAMRNHLLKKLPEAGFTAKEERLSIATLLSADEVFLTNVIRGIRPVKQFQKTNYSNKLTREIFNKVMAPLTNG